MTLRTLRSAATLVAAIIATMALGVTGAFAQAYPTAPADGVACTDAEPGSTAQCAVGGATPGEVLDWSATSDGDEFASGQVTADDAGTAFFSVEIPTDVLGVVHVRVTGDQGFEGSTTINATADGDTGTPVTDDDDTATGTLPITGGQITFLVALAVGLIAAGAVATRKKDKVGADA